MDIARLSLEYSSYKSDKNGKMHISNDLTVK